jgi:hypothetical protein
MKGISSFGGTSQNFETLIQYDSFMHADNASSVLILLHTCTAAFCISCCMAVKVSLQTLSSIVEVTSRAAAALGCTITTRARRTAGNTQDSTERT